MSLLTQALISVASELVVPVAQAALQTWQKQQNPGASAARFSSSSTGAVPLRQFISAVQNAFVGSRSGAAPQVTPLQSPRMPREALERVRVQVAEATNEETRTQVLRSRLAGLAAGNSGFNAHQAFIDVHGYIEGIPRMLSTLQASVDGSAPRAPSQGEVDAAASAFLSAPPLAGEPGLIALVGKAYLFWELLLTSEDDRNDVGPDLLRAHQLVATLIGPELKGQHDRSAASLRMTSVAAGPALVVTALQYPANGVQTGVPADSNTEKARPSLWRRRPRRTP